MKPYLVEEKGVQMENRTFQEAAPSTETAGIDPALLNLVRLRIAQIHRYPIGMEKHRLDLETQGESNERLDQLTVWRESSLFSDPERAALALGESVSLDPIDSIPKQLVEEARRHFDKEQMISLLVAIMAVNDWNYLCTSSVAEAPLPGGPSRTSKNSQSHANQTTSSGLIFKIPRAIQGGGAFSS
jgi:alkylhydroperoxidase family enzyme